MQHYGFCHLSCIPVRADADDRSEMVNQLLFGETFEFIDQFNGWKVIRGTLDIYEGFIGERQFIHLSEEQFISNQQVFKRFPKSILSSVQNSRNGLIWITPACSLDFFDENGILKIGDLSLNYSCETTIPPTSPCGKDIVDTAMKYLNVPYLWGGRSLFGIDCSGLVQNVFKINGIQMSRDASQQVSQGKTVFLISESVPGDLAFFENNEGEIVHVGIIINHESIIHASGSVRIDTIDHHGIFNKELKKYTHNLRIIKRIIDVHQ
jgi:gamma-D-glutamyl-L-lysine dipeptidyl-peptidase